MNPLKLKGLAAGILVAALCAASALSAAPVSQRRAAGGPNVAVTGSVTDGSGHGWPIYARIEITSASTDPVVVFSDPVTGTYSVDLPDATAYTFAVTSVAPGYAAGGGPVATAGSPLVANWTLVVGALCSAPGYEPGTFGTPVLSESFDAGVVPAGWSVVNNSQDGGPWTVLSGADPCGLFDGNRTGGSGPFAIVNSDCDGFVTDDTSLVTAPIDLSSSPDAALQWANDLIDDELTETLADVDVTLDGGATWTNVWHSTLGVPGPGTVTADMSFAAGHAGVQARFHYSAFFGYWWQVDDVAVRPFTCTVLAGGLVVGSVADANTGAGLNGATVTSLADGGSTMTVASPGQGDGFYSLFVAGSGAQDFTASAALHNPVTKNATVADNAVVRLDFALPAGLLDAGPRPLSAVVTPGGSQSVTLDVSNSGTGNGTFSLHEVNVAPAALPAAAKPAFVLSLADRRALRQQFTLGPVDARAARTGLPQAAVDVAAGAGLDLLNSFASGLVNGYGLAYDTDSDRLWISNPDAPRAGLNGDGLDYEYQPDGTATGATIAFTPEDWQADGTYNARTGMIWQVRETYLVDGPDQCIFEIDPVAKVVTGKQICGPWGNFPPIVGLAYDYATDTYYVGDALGGITHVDGAGSVLDSGHIWTQIAGLAYNPTTRHLFVESFQPDPQILDGYVVDPAHDYATLSGYLVTSGGVPAVAGRGVSLEADCAGHLWTYDVFNNVVYEFESGEPGWCVNDIPWLSEDPASGTIPGSGGAARPAGAANTLPVTVTFDSDGVLPGLYRRSLVFTTDTPDPVAPVPVDFTVLFNDVPPDSFAANFIYGAAGAGVMPGCAPQAPLYAFCPAEVVTRRTMAGYIERAVHGALAPPPVYLAEFNDVLLGSFNADYIQGLVDDAITAGCGGGNYCPDVPVTRAQMAVFVWKGQHGAEAPPACTPPGSFADVPCPGGFAVDYVEGIAAEGVTAGCGSGNYCPNASITNAQMAVFLVKAFAIPYLP